LCDDIPKVPIKILPQASSSSEWTSSGRTQS
jgi:hypothetical protein